MKEYDLNKLITNQDYLNCRINEFMSKKLILKQGIDPEEIKGHIMKSDHNLRFVQEIIGLTFPDWVLVGCYYSVYHVVLALIQTKGYSSKNHLATLCILIKEFYDKEINEKDIEFLSDMLDYQDVLFYVESKNKREDAAYSSRIKFDKKEIRNLRIRTAVFSEKVKNLIQL
jgi:uncharacterized protein (UPF0332 family)